MRQFLDETHRIRDEYAGLRLGLQGAHRRVKRCEELVCYQDFATRERSHERRLTGVGVADQCDPQLIATRGPALIVVPLNNLQLVFQLGEAITDLASIEFEIGLARAVTLLPLAATRRFPQTRRYILQLRHLDLQLRLATMRMTMENLHDHTSPIEYLR